MEAVLVGDTHFDGRLKSLVPDANEFIIEELEAVTKYAYKKGIANVIFLGDVGDKPRLTYEAQELLVKFFRRHPNLKFTAILGNHDMFSEDPEAGHSLQLLKWAASNLEVIEKPTTRKFGKARVRFLPWPHTDFDDRALNIFHSETYGSKGDTGRVFKDDGLTKSPAVCIGGHLHTPHRVRNTYYIGTLYQTTFGEDAQKYFGHVIFESPKKYKVKMVPHVPRYSLRTVTIESRADLKILPDDPNILVRLAVKDGVDIRPQDLKGRTNIVLQRHFKSKEELETVLLEDVKDGNAIQFKTSDFVKAWADVHLAKDQEMQKAVRRLHRSLCAKETA